MRDYACLTGRAGPQRQCIAAAAHLSAIDYIGDVPWEEHQAAREWYSRVKSRPSFQPLLEDRIPGFTPAGHYENVDF